ncbi:ABC transporter ATP-binding protein [Sulfurospirillum arcachonense]|uniref:ABC transporter ATP-binding protein n=1 Tax=Sulfurospirillum arcachonense TaxID=57666 RepID=UPI0004B029D1|nr:ABC transporter ATP-binding protein [Sulfurospirillum arcachonense]
MRSKILIRNLYKIYNEKKENEFFALKNINLNIKCGEIVIIKGISGSGKSTLLSLIGALSKPSSGDILVNEQNIAKLPDIFSSQYRNEEVGFIFQSFNLVDGLSVYDNVKAPLVLSNINQDELKKKINLALEVANIAHKSQQMVSNLSGGEKQRCAIARALVNSPSLILADEPTANLDKNNSLIFVDILKKFKQLNKTVVVATHDTIFDNLAFVDTYVNIEDGAII